MGKGGYTGGSTIIHISKSNDSTCIGENLDENYKIYACKICNNKFIGLVYFEHLRSHGLEGCYQCGEPYEPKKFIKNNVRVCHKCGKRTPVFTGTKCIKNQYNTQDESFVCKKNTNDYADDETSSSGQKNIIKNNNKFCLSIGNLLQSAIDKKTTE